MAKSKVRQSKFIWAASVIVLIIAGYFVYQYVATQINKRDFIQARAAIDAVYVDIVAKVGQPDNSKRTNDCSRPSEEFEQGPLSCSVATDFIYGVDNEEQANQLFKQIQGVIAMHSDQFKPTKPLSGAIADTLVVNTYYHSTLDYYQNAHGLLCVSSYIYDTPREINLSIKNSDKKSFEAGIACSGSAKSQYYSLDQ